MVAEAVEEPAVLGGDGAGQSARFEVDHVPLAETGYRARDYNRPLHIPSPMWTRNAPEPMGALNVSPAFRLCVMGGA